MAIDEPNFLFWKGDHVGVFSVKGLCMVLEESWFNQARWVVPKEVRKLVLVKVSQFVWQLQRNRVATKEALMARGIVIPGGGVCCFCLVCVESSSHCFCIVIMSGWCGVQFFQEKEHVG